MELPPDVDPKKSRREIISEMTSGFVSPLKYRYLREDFTDKERKEFGVILKYIIKTYTDENSLAGKKDDKDITGADFEKRKWAKYTKEDTKISEAHAILIAGAISAIKLHNQAYKRLKSKIKDLERLDSVASESQIKPMVYALKQIIEDGRFKERLTRFDILVYARIMGDILRLTKLYMPVIQATPKKIGLSEKLADKLEKYALVLLNNYNWSNPFNLTDWDVPSQPKDVKLYLQNLSDLIKTILIQTWEKLFSDDTLTIQEIHNTNMFKSPLKF